MIIGMQECNRPDDLVFDAVSVEHGDRLPQARRIIRDTKGKSHEYIVEHMRAKHDNGDGTVELEDA